MITQDIQKLDAGEFVQLFTLDLSELGGDTLRFHPHIGSGSIVWQGERYDAWAIEVEGFARTGEGQQPSPSLRVSNIDSVGNVGTIAALCIALADMVGATLTRTRTFAKYLDAVNFKEGNPTADPNQALPLEVWKIEQKSQMTPEWVTFELSSVLDFGGQQLPANQVIANGCLAVRVGGYRGWWCKYAGDKMFDVNGNPVHDRASDKCGGRLSDCKLRHGNGELPFVGVPSADKIRGY